MRPLSIAEAAKTLRCRRSEVEKLIAPADHGDFTNDGYVDTTDFDLFEACATGPAIPYNPAPPSVAESNFLSVLRRRL